MGEEQIGQRCAADEVGRDRAAGRAQPAAGLFPDGVAERGGQELKGAQNDQVQRQELFDGGEGVGGAVRAGRDGSGMRAPARAAGDGLKILGPEVIGESPEQIFDRVEERFDPHATPPTDPPDSPS